MPESTTPDAVAEYTACIKAMAAGDTAAANQHWHEFVRILYLQLKLAGAPVEWEKKGANQK